jgi:hypothetical protein
MSAALLGQTWIWTTLLAKRVERKKTHMHKRRAGHPPSHSGSSLIDLGRLVGVYN